MLNHQKMYVTEDQAIKLVEDFSKKASDEYLEKFEFLSRLLQDDDWSFIIKAHSLIESLVTELIINKIDEKLRNIVERMPLQGDTVSKVNIAKTYDLIPKEQRIFLKKISEIRNKVVHKYENINFTFDNYFSQLDDNSKKNWKKTIIWAEMDEGIVKQINELFPKSPKAAIWLSLSCFVNVSLINISLSKGINALNEESKKTTIELLKDI